MPGPAAPAYPQSFTFAQPPGMAPPPFSTPYTPPAAQGGASLSRGTVPSAPLAQSPLSQMAMPIPVPGNPGLFYIPHHYGQPQPLMQTSPVFHNTETVELAAPLTADSETTPKDDHDLPNYCFQCQQWHSSKKDQEQAHAAFQTQSGSTPTPQTVQLGKTASESMGEDAFAARMSQAIKEAVASEFESRNMSPRCSCGESLEDHRHESNTHHRLKQLGSRDLKPDIRDDTGFKYPRRHSGVSSLGRKYAQAYVQESRSATPSDARAWYDAFTDLDPDEVRAQSGSDLTTVFSDMTVRDYKHVDRGKLRKSFSREYEADDYSSEDKNSEENTGLPLKYLPSRYPNPPARNKKDPKKHEKPSTKKSRTENIANLEAEAPKRQHKNTSGRSQRDTLRQRGETEKELEREPDKTPKKQGLSKGVTRTREKAGVDSPSPMPDKTISPTTADAQAAVLAYAQWYAETHGIGQYFVRNLEASMFPTNAASSPGYHRYDTQQYQPTKATERSLSSNKSKTSVSNPPVSTVVCDDQSDNGSISSSDRSPDESSTKSDGTVRENRRHNTRPSDQGSSIRGGSICYSSPTSSDLERITNFLLQRKIQFLQSMTPRKKTTNQGSSETHENIVDEERETQQKNPLPAILHPTKRDTEPSPLVLERARRRYSLILDENSQSLKYVPAEVATAEKPLVNVHLGKAPTPISASHRQHPYFQPEVETVIDEDHPECQTEWTWDRKLGAYVNTSTNRLRLSTETPVGISEHEYEKLKSKLSTTQVKDTIDSPVRTEGGEVSVFDYQVGQLPEIKGLLQSTNEGGHEEKIDMQEGDDDGWEDECEQGDASDIRSEYGSYVSELLSELVSGKYSDVISGMYSDANTEITGFPGIDSTTDESRMSGYVSDGTMDIILSAIEKGKKQRRQKRGREGGERQSGGVKLYSRGSGDFMVSATRPK